MFFSFATGSVQPIPPKINGINTVGAWGAPEDLCDEKRQGLGVVAELLLGMEASGVAAVAMGRGWHALRRYL
jgi:hypothetical protein